MGQFTDGMRRLRESANAAKQKRNDLMQRLQQGRHDLASNVDTFINDFRNDFTAKSQQQRRERQDFVNHIVTTVDTLREDCRQAQQARIEAFTQMSQTNRASRANFVSGLQETIGNMRHELTADRAEARRIWLELSIVTQPVQPDKSISKKTS